MLLLGLGNKARHGKDSFAQAVIRYHANLDAVRAKHNMLIKPTIIQHLHFADALYKEVNMFLTSDTGKRWLVGEERKPSFAHILRLPEWVTPDSNPSMTDPRAPHGKHAKLLQWWGTEFRRSKDPDYWVKQFKAAVNPKADIVMTTDMRFLNEAHAVRDLGGYTIQVNRLNHDGTPFVDPSRDPNHTSEIDLDSYNYDYKITVKTGDLVLLDEWAMTLVHFLRARASK